MSNEPLFFQIIITIFWCISTLLIVCIYASTREKEISRNIIHHTFRQNNKQYTKIEICTIILEFYQLSCISWLTENLFVLNRQLRNIITISIGVPDIGTELGTKVMLCLLYIVPFLLIGVGLCGFIEFDLIDELFQMLRLPLLMCLMTWFPDRIVRLDEKYGAAFAIVLIYINILVLGSLGLSFDKQINSFKQITYGNPLIQFINTLLVIMNVWLVKEQSSLMCVSIALIGFLMYIIYVARCHKSMAVAIFHQIMLLNVMWSYVLTLIAIISGHSIVWINAILLIFGYIIISLIGLVILMKNIVQEPDDGYINL